MVMIELFDFNGFYLCVNINKSLTKINLNLKTLKSINSTKIMILCSSKNMASCLFYGLVLPFLCSAKEKSVSCLSAYSIFFLIKTFNIY